MNQQAVNLNNCDTEPIHIPGQIQSHGFLIVIDEQGIIKFHSENISDFLQGLPPYLLGSNIITIEPSLSKNSPAGFITKLIDLVSNSKNFDSINPFHTEINGADFCLIISASGPYYLLEFEPALSDIKADIQKLIGSSLAEMLADRNLVSLLKNSATQVKNIINYDRVMVYRFAADGHGEVIAEAKNENLPAWLGLHYPASDIPKQARELYKLNLTRIIADVNTTPSKIFTIKDNAETTLDLTYSQLRAVSPIHIQYLKNMGVHSSFSISLIYKKELWGLIACHNYSPRFIDYKSRESSKLIGQILSSALEFRQDEANQHLQEHFNTNVDKLSKFMLKNNSIENALTQQEATLLDVTNAHGAVLVYEHNITKLGKTPDNEQLQCLLTWIKTNITETFYSTNTLPEIFPDAIPFKQVSSGIMVLTLSAELGEYIIWFKPEHIETITWAGNPDKPVEVSGDGLMKISPRNSFEAWTQEISDKSESWSDGEIKSAMRLKTEVIYAINQKAGAIRLLNERLKQAYEELDTFSYTISHDLKNPLATIKGFAQILTRNKTIDPQAHEILLRIDGKVDRMNVMINEVLEYSRIGRVELEPVTIETTDLINEHIKDLKIAYNADNLKVTIGNTPAVQGDPMMIGQVFANLLSNAIKYSIPSGNPEIFINGEDKETEIIYTIKDNGIGIDIKQLPKVFELFKRMDNAHHIEGTGVGLAIVKRIIEKHKGKIWVDSELGKGATFFVSFKK